jgi:hypothetical protein
MTRSPGSTLEDNPDEVEELEFPEEDELEVPEDELEVVLED